jgi:hypothetical protein
MLVSFSCQKDDFEAVQTIDPEISLMDDVTFVENFGTSTTSSFIGRIVDVDGNNIKDVQVTIGNEITMTDHNGVFVLNNVAVYEKFAYIKAEKNGYINGSRALVPTTNGINDVQITLLEKNIVATVSSGSESEVSLPNGAKVSFQGDFIDSNGNTYNGQVEVSMHYLEPNQEITFVQMPGMLFAQDASNNARSLETYGMLGVNLYSPSGDQLNISETTPAILTFPVDTSTPNAPDSITLWYFDEIVGYWKEQGEATKVGNEYVAEVNHFTWWNCDLPLDYISACFKLSSQGVLTNFFVEVIRNSTNQIIFSGYTNTNGEECGYFPSNEDITILIYNNECNQNFVHQQVYSSLSDGDIIEVIVPSSSDYSETIVQGTINDCNGNPLSEGYALIFDDNGIGSYITISIENGQINYNLSYCNGSNYNQIIIYDTILGNNSGFIPVSINSGSTNLGVISICTPTGGVYTGNVDLLSQSELENFSLNGYSKIDGNFSIRAFNGYPGDFSSLSTLTEVTGGITLHNNYVTTNLYGLHNITTVGGNLYISGMNTLVNLSGLDGLVSIGSIQLAGNNSLESLEGLNHLTSVGDISINGTSSLNSIEALSNLNSIGGRLNITSTYSLTSLAGLENVTGIGGDLIINNEDYLQSLEGLSGLSVIIGDLIISGNYLLPSTLGLDNLTSVSSIDISDNTNLSNYCSLVNLMTSGVYISFNAYAGNAYNPSEANMLTNNCSN